MSECENCDRLARHIVGYKKHLVELDDKVKDVTKDHHAVERKMNHQKVNIRGLENSNRDLELLRVYHTNQIKTALDALEEIDANDKPGKRGGASFATMAKDAIDAINNQE